MKIIFLGTNGWYTSPTGDTPCILIDSKDQYVILDAGNGIYKLDKYITEDKPVSLFITHFHIDHISGLHTLAKFTFKQGIDVYVGQGRVMDFETFVNPPFTISYKQKLENKVNLTSEIRLHELAESLQTPFKVAAISQHHSDVDHGFRLELEGKIIAYTGDCGVSAAARKLAEGADILICECSNKKTLQPNDWGHMDPILAASLAKESAVKQLLLTHFVATEYTSLEQRKKAEKVARQIFPQTTAAYDEFEFSV